MIDGALLCRGLAGALFALGSVAATAQADGGTPPSAAAMCTTCHGAKGLATAPDAPHLAGQPPIYLVAQLKAYRGGARKHEVMSVIAKPLKDDEIEQLARWYSNFKIEVK